MRNHVAEVASGFAKVGLLLLTLSFGAAGFLAGCVLAHGLGVGYHDNGDHYSPFIPTNPPGARILGGLMVGAATLVGLYLPLSVRFHGRRAADTPGEREGDVGVPRNRIARAALVIALICLVQPLAVLAMYACLHLGFTEPDRLAEPVGLIAGVIQVSSVLFLKADFFLGLPALILGFIGLRAARRLPGRAGRREAIAAILLGLLMPMVSAANYLLVASDWKQ